MKSICFFSSYFENDSLPYYVEVYLLELKNHFSELIFISNEKKLNDSTLTFLKSNSIHQLLVKNEGYDFGMWSKALVKYPIENYERVALVNDSCVLFAPLTPFMNWVSKSNLDYCGFSESHAISYHIQSFFLVLNSKAALLAKDYFAQVGILPEIKQVIEKYEVGLSTFLLSKGLKLGAYLSNDAYKGEFSPYYHLLESHIQQGVPLIKKKIVFSTYRNDELFTLIRMNFNIDASYYFDLIKKRNAPPLLLDMDRLYATSSPAMSAFQIRMYTLKRHAFHWLKKFLRK